jgi:hypothetical protein
VPYPEPIYETASSQLVVRENLGELETPERRLAIRRWQESFGNECSLTINAEGLHCKMSSGTFLAADEGSQHLAFRI